MGALLTRLLSLIQSSRSCRILMVGLDAAGKTTILYKLKLGEVVSTIPTIGFNVETVEYKNISFTVWDVGGQAKLRPLWRHYYQNTAAVVYVVDSSDAERLQEAREELDAILESDEVAGVPLLVVANKQDLPGALSVPQLSEGLDLRRHDRPWHVQPTCAITSEGVYEALDWLARRGRNDSRRNTWTPGPRHTRLGSGEDTPEGFEREKIRTLVESNTRTPSKSQMNFRNKVTRSKDEPYRGRKYGFHEESSI